MLDKQFGPWKEKGKKKLEVTNSNNTMPQITKEDTAKKNNDGDKRKTNHEHHAGECLKKTNKCFCGWEAGHIKRNCPNLYDNKNTE